jgi:serine/threonine-protein kinase
VRELIGEGVLGAVYRGFQISVARDVAIKLLRPRFAADVKGCELLFPAVQRACQLVRPTVVTTLDVGYSGEAIYIVAELVRGRSLAELLAPKKPLGIRRAAAFAYQIADALVAAHARGIIHGDLKPANVIVTGEALKVTDFGFTRALVRDPWAGDPHLAQYTAPELDANVAPTVASDLYALGCICHEMLTGKPAFTASSVGLLLERHRTEPPPRLPRDVPPSLAAIVDQLLRKQPDARFASAADVLAVLKPHAPDALELAPAPVARDEPSQPFRGSPTTQRTQPVQVPPHGTVPPYTATTPPVLHGAAPPPARSSTRVLVIAIIAAVLSLAGVAIYLFSS